MTSWRELFFDAFLATEDRWPDIVYCTLSEHELDIEFDSESDDVEGYPFTAWSREWVYFPAQYCGSEWVAYAPRQPIEHHATEHIGA